MKLLTKSNLLDANIRWLRYFQKEECQAVLDGRKNDGSRKARNLEPFFVGHKIFHTERINDLSHVE